MEKINCKYDGEVIGYVEMECSNHGVCINSSDISTTYTACECYPGYMGHSDILSLANTVQFPNNQNTNFMMENIDCQISIAALTGLYITAIIVNIIAFIFVIPRIKIAFKKHQDKSSTLKKKGKQYTLLNDNRGLLSILLFYGISFPCMIAVSLIKIIDPIQAIGYDILITLLFIVLRIAMYLSSGLFQMHIITTTLKSVELLRKFSPNGNTRQRRMDSNKLMWLNKAFAIAMFIFSVTPCVFLLPGLSNNVRSFQDFKLLYILFCSFTAVGFLGEVYRSSYIEKGLTLIYKDILPSSQTPKSSEENNPSIVLMRVLIHSQKVTRIQTIVQFALMIFCLVYPPMYSRYSYIIAVQFIPFLMVGVVETSMHNKEQQQHHHQQNQETQEKASKNAAELGKVDHENEGARSSLFASNLKIESMKWITPLSTNNSAVEPSN